MPRRCCVVANPASGGGRGARVLAAVREAFAAHGITDVRVTSTPGQERELAQRAALDGIDTIVAMGGDGTWGNAAAGILESGRDARLALVATGTGNDFAFATRIPATDIAAACAIATGESERRVDVGVVDGRAFLNVCGFGFDAEVLAASNARTWLSGHARYLVTAAQKLLFYPGTYAAHATDDDVVPADPRRLLMLTVSNGPRFGGGFLIAPGAFVDDGKLDVVAVNDASPFRRVALFAGATRGTHVRAPEVTVRQARRVRVRFHQPPWFDADGELHRATAPEVTVECLPARMRVASPAS